MGIENKVKQKYGRNYWEKNKWAILKKAGKHHVLNQETVYPNARERRYMERHVEDYGFALFWSSVEAFFLTRPS